MVANVQTVALLKPQPSAGLVRGQVGTIVETIAENTALVEFSDDEGRAYAIVRCSRNHLLALHYEPEAAE